MTKIEIKSTPHRRVPVVDILPNPHRDLKANPLLPEKIDGLVESYERNGFWDNIVVREHPTREGKFQLAYGHNRLAALKHKKVSVDTITIPVAKLNDWEMYCAMVDENEVANKLTIPVVMENIVVGCELIEAALKKIGPKGTWEEFNEAMGSVVSADTTLRHKLDGGFEQVRNAFNEGEGIGRVFLADFLPCGKIRANTVNEIVNMRYGAARAKAKEAQAQQARDDAAKAARAAAIEQDAEKKRELTEKAEAKRKEQKKKEDESDRIAKGVISRDVMLLFDSPRTMTDFAEAARRLGVPPAFHARAAEAVIKAKVKEERIFIELDNWWQQAGGEAAKKSRERKRQAELDKLLKKTQGRNYISVLSELAEHLLDDEKDWKVVVAATHLLEAAERRVIENKIVPIAALITTLIERSRARVDEGEGEAVPAMKMLEHQRR